MKEVLFKISNISKRYKGKSKVLDNISFEGTRNTVIGIIGPNGSGKTTLLSILAGVIHPTSGSVEIIANNSIGATLGHASFFPHLTAFENLEFVARLKRLAPATIKSEIFDILDKVGLEDNVLATNFSYGMEQRYGIASAMLASPDIILLDEPTNGIDPLDIEDILGLIKSTSKDKCIVFSSHQIAEIIQLADLVLGLSDGEVMFFDSIENLQIEAQQADLNLKEYLLHNIKRS